MEINLKNYFNCNAKKLNAQLI